MIIPPLLARRPVLIDIPLFEKKMTQVFQEKLKALGDAQEGDDLDSKTQQV